jgi:hypothetical protein
MSPEDAVSVVKSVPIPKLDLSNSGYTVKQQEEIDYMLSALLKSYRNAAIATFKEKG